MSTTEEEKLQCTTCGQRIAYEQADRGREIACPSCSRMLQIPHEPAEIAAEVDSQTQVLPPAVQPVHQNTHGGLPVDVAVGLAEEQIQANRQTRQQDAEQFGWRKKDRQRNRCAVVGFAGNIVLLVMLAAAMLNVENARGYLVFSAMLASLGGLLFTILAAIGAVNAGHTAQTDTYFAWFGLVFGIAVLLLLPAAWGMTGR